MSKAQEQAETFSEICYAAFQTHYKCVRKDGMPEPEVFWEQNKGARVLWHGLVKGMVINLVEAQRQGLLPKLVEVDPAPLPGLGGAPVAIVGNTGPAALARALGARIRAQVDGATGPDLKRAGSPWNDEPPGLAVGRATGDEPEGEHSVVLDAIEEHIRGGDDEA